MRVLITVNPAPGHLFALVPLAWALHLDGHQVIVAAPRALAPLIRRAGLTAAVTGGDATLTGDRTAAGDDLDAFVTLAEHTAGDVVALVRDWQPDLLVTEPAEFAGPLAATLTNTPWVLHHGGLPGPEAQQQAALDRVADRLARLGPPPKPPLVTIDTCPPGIRPPGTDNSVLPMRHVSYHGACTAPDWLLRPPVLPRVCVSMGTRPQHEGPHALRVALDALSDLDVEVVVSGAGVHDLVDLPARVRRIGWLPHHLLLATADLFVHHSGPNSAMSALVAGRPQLLMPQPGSQSAVAERLTQAGVARCVPYAERGVAAVRIAALDLLGHPFYAARAGRLRDEIAALPGPSAVTRHLAALIC